MQVSNFCDLHKQGKTIPYTKAYIHEECLWLPWKPWRRCAERETAGRGTSSHCAALQDWGRQHEARALTAVWTPLRAWSPLPCPSPCPNKTKVRNHMNCEFFPNLFCAFSPDILCSVLCVWSKLILCSFLCVRSKFIQCVLSKCILYSILCVWSKLIQCFIILITMNT